MKSVSDFQGVFFHREPVDMRKAVNGLSQIVEQAKMGELMGPHLFVFANRRRDLMKVLYFDRSGFALWTKKLEKDKFPWPKGHESTVVPLTSERFEWLLDGYDVWKMKPFEKLNFTRFS
jgi:transposase